MPRFDTGLLAQTVSAVNGAARPGRKEDALTLFVAQQGRQYSKELMYVGRATNGWVGSWSPRRSMSPQMVRRIVSYASDGSLPTGRRDEACPMAWVIDWWGKGRRKYNTKTSAFWRVARRLAIELRLLLEVGAKEEWPSSLVWSNLYKVAPRARANPSDRLCDIQLRLCARILSAEVDFFRPQYLVLATGWNWARDFLPAIAREGTIKRLRGRYLQGRGTLRTGGRFVVVPHPQAQDTGKVVAAALAGLRGGRPD